MPFCRAASRPFCARAQRWRSLVGHARLRYPKGMGRSSQPFGALFARYPQVQAAFLFGSRARGQARADSDWDLAVYLEPPEPDPTLDLLTDLVKAGFERVDLLVLNHAPLVLAFEVVRANRVVYQRAGFCLGCYVSRVVREYWDLEPLLRVQREAMKRRWLGDPA